MFAVQVFAQTGEIIRLPETIIKCPKIVVCPSGTQGVSCWGKDNTSFYHLSKYNTLPNVRKFVRSSILFQFMPDYAQSFQSVNLPDYVCNGTTGGGDILPPIVKCIQDNAFYYLTNYVGLAFAWGGGRPIPYNGKPIERFLIYSPNATDNPGKDILNAWNFFSGKKYNSRLCEAGDVNGYPAYNPPVAVGTLLPVTRRITTFPQGHTIYCADMGHFYRFTDTNNTAENVDFSARNYVAGYSTFDEMKLIADNPNCAYNDTTGNRLGPCALSEEIQYIQSCGTQINLSKRDDHYIRFIGKRQCSIAPQVDGQYYTCGNDIATPKRVWIYTLKDNSLRYVPQPQEITTEWLKLIATTPQIPDCSCYSGFSFKRGLMNRKRIINTVQNKAVAPSITNVVNGCGQTKSVTNALSLLKAVQCDSIFSYGLAVKSDKTINGVCFDKYTLECSRTLPCTLQGIAKSKAECEAIFQRVVLSSSYGNLYPFCDSTDSKYSYTKCNSKTTGVGGIWSCNVGGDRKLPCTVLYATRQLLIGGYVWTS